MSIEKKAEALLEAATNLVNAVTAFTGGENTGDANTATVTTPPATDKKATKKELAEMKKEAKQLAGKVLKELGKDKLGELLGQFNAEKFGQLKNEPEVYTEFITDAQAVLDSKAAAGEDDDLLGDGPAETAEVTQEDVKALLLKVNNHEDLGKDVTRQLLADHGAARFGELKSDKFASVAEAAKKAIDEAL